MFPDDPTTHFPKATSREYLSQQSDFISFQNGGLANYN